MPDSNVGCRRRQQFQNEEYPVTQGHLTWLDQHSCKKPDGELYGTLGYAVRVLGIPEWALRAGRKSSRFFEGKRLLPEMVKPPYPRAKKAIRIWPVAKLKALQEQLSANGAESRDHLGTWLPLKAVCQRLGKSKTFVLHWAGKESKLRPGDKALRSKEDWAKSAHRTGPARCKFYLVEDAERILAGHEYREAPKGVRNNQSYLASVLERDKATLKEILCEAGPLPSGRFEEEARKRQMSKYRFRRARKALKLQRKRVCTPGFPTPAAVWYWGLQHQKFPETPLPDRTETQAGITQNKSESAQERGRNRRGRPKGSTDPEVAERKKQLLEAWDRGEFASKAAAGRAYDFHKPDAIKIINQHEKQKGRNNSPRRSAVKPS